MEVEMDLERIRTAVSETGVGAWLLYDFHGLNPIATAVAGIRGMVTRRWFCLIRPDAPPHWIVHAIERNAFAGQTEERHDRTLFGPPV